MSKLLKLTLAAGVIAGTAQADGYGLGRDALADEVAAWDIDVRPDGQGLPAGSGDVWTGEEIFVENCAMCHGDFGEAVGRWPALAGGWNSIDSEDPVKTVGSYWPYLSTVYDYVYRAMPFGNARSLSPDDVYAITAYLLYVNNLVEDDFELSDQNFAEVELPNQANFYMDDRAQVEYPQFSTDPCMSDCKTSVEITSRAVALNVTPEDDSAETAAPEEVVAAAETTPEPPALDPELVAEGQSVFRKCQSCHQVGDGAVNRTGPVLNNIAGRQIGSVDGFRYSNGFKALADSGEVWTPEALAEFLTNPRAFVRGNRMSFAGLRDPADIDAVLAYIQSESP